MVVMWGFGFIHGSERKVEKEREIREMRDIILDYIFYYLDILF